MTKDLIEDQIEDLSFFSEIENNRNQGKVLRLVFSFCEVEKNNKKHFCWFILN